jgi:hypothetical protein
MKLVVTWTISDGCTYSCDMTQPVEYDSPEAFIIEFEEKAKSAKGINFFVAGKTWNKWDFTEKGVLFLPTVRTLEEWFEQER